VSVAYLLRSVASAPMYVGGIIMSAS